MLRKCDHCGKEYNADERNLKRGWGLTCSKSCAAKKREMSKPNYDPNRVKANNIRRAVWWDNDHYEPRSRGYDFAGCPYDDGGDDEYWDGKDFD